MTWPNYENVLYTNMHVELNFERSMREMNTCIFYADIFEWHPYLHDFGKEFIK